MATPTYDFIDEYTTTGTSTFSFTSIPQGYRDLILVCTGSYAQQYARLNNNSGFVYPSEHVQGIASTANNSGDDTNKLPISLDDGISIIQIFDYSQTDREKTILMTLSRLESGSDKIIRLRASRFISTTNITSIDFTDVRGSVGQPATFRLYGIAG